MSVEERKTTNGHDCDVSSSMIIKSEATNNDNDGLLLHSDGGSSNFGVGSSADALRIYTRRKRRKMSNSDEVDKKLNDTIKTADNSVASNQEDLARLTLDVFPTGECSPGRCRRLVLQKMYQSLNGGEDGLRECIRNALVTHPETAIKETLNYVDGVVVDQTQYSAKEHSQSHVLACGLLNELENVTNTELCRRAFLDILMSEKFSELCGLLHKNFGDVNVQRVLNVDVINSRMKDGAYETSPLLYLTDIEQLWSKLRKVGNEMVALAQSLSENSRTHYEQFVRKPRATGPSDCRGCGLKADVRTSLICDSCEEMYHVSCTELLGTEIPPKSWYCTNCVSNGIGSPHDTCAVCDRLKAAAPSPLAGPIPATDIEPTDPFYVNRSPAEDSTSRVCFVCKSEVNSDENSKTCGHELCVHKLYHQRCLTIKQLPSYGPCWYCPSCLCRGCLVDKDDDQIVLCDGCDQAYHIYCMSPPRSSIPSGAWFCAKCDRDVKRIREVKRVYEKMTKKVKIEGGVDKTDDMNGEEGLDMLVSAAKTLDHEDETR